MLDFAFLVFGGVLAGIINTLAGNGSVITLSLCTELIGLSPSIANGTNRLGVLTQSISGAATLYRNKRLNLEHTWPAMITVIIGALFGIALAVMIDESSFKKLYPWFLLFIFIVLLLKPEKWIHEQKDIKAFYPFYIYPVLFIVGAYGGLIQLGVGVFFLATMIMLGRHPWKIANNSKIVVVGIFTVIAVAVFGFSGYIHLPTAVALAIGQSIGAWIAAKHLTQHKQAQKISYYILLAVTGYTIIKNFIF